VPLASNMEQREYKLGEYILEENKEPEGLYIVSSGRIKVGSVKLEMRAKAPSKYERFQVKEKDFITKGNFHDNEDLY